MAAAPRLAVLCSGQGTNLQALLDAAKAGRLGASVALVISDRKGAFALTRATRAKVEACIVDRAAYPDKPAFEQALWDLIDARNIRLICLAGFMRVLSPAFVRRYANRILNIHPSLLPAFPGAHALRDALAWGAKVTGVTIHLVDDEVDHGPIVLQEAVRIMPGDTEAKLLARVHRVEHQLYPKAVRLMLSGKVRVAGRLTRAA